MQQWLEKISQVDWTNAILIFILGIGIVFSVLILLWGILSLMKVFFYKEGEPKKAEQIKAPMAKERKMSQPKVRATAPPKDEDELVALLNGAVAAYANTTSLRVKSYKKIK